MYALVGMLCGIPLLTLALNAVGMISPNSMVAVDIWTVFACLTGMVLVGLGVRLPKIRRRS